MNHFNDKAHEWDKPEKVNMMKKLATNTKSILNIEKKGKVLDFGCGTGLFGLEFEDLANEIVGIDTSEEMLKVWDKKTEGHTNISRQFINLEEENLSDKFDLIVSSMTFHHLNKPAELLIKLSQSLLDNGKMAIVDLEKEDGSFHPDNKKMGVNHFGFDENEIQSWANAANMKVKTYHINSIKKNDREYGQFLAIFEKKIS